MRTREARRKRDRALKDAKRNGHKVEMSSESGAGELYGCLRQGCNDLMDCWDAPAIVNGPMPHRKCTGDGNRHQEGGNRLPGITIAKNIFSKLFNRGG